MEAKVTFVLSLAGQKDALARNLPAQQSQEIKIPRHPVHRCPLAIVVAGYRELAKRFHPDAGGSAETMALISQAKQQLSEILAVARGV